VFQDVQINGDAAVFRRCINECYIWSTVLYDAETWKPKEIVSEIT
jgi:hypothetical protein